jgi:uncharacterized protein YjeT (DUF2065 family)
MKFLFTLIGLVFILEGLPYLTFPEAMQRWLRQLMEMRTGQLRVVGFFAVVLGLLICYVTLRSSLFN